MLSVTILNIVMLNIVVPYCTEPSQLSLVKIANDSSLTQVFNFRLGRFANEQYFHRLYERTLPCISSFSHNLSKRI
jgi:hypothetical protein